jgi:signal transduction histidine kinase
MFGGIIISVEASTLADKQYNVLITSLILIVVICLIYKEIEKSIFLYILSMVLIIMIQIIILAPLYLIMGKIEYTFAYGMIVQTAGITIVLIMVKFIPINILFNYIEKKNQVFKIICIDIIVVVWMILTFSNVDFEGLIENIAIIIIFAMLVMIITIIFLRNGLKNLNAEEQVRIYEQYLPIVDELVDELRAKQHDFDNHLLAIKMMIEMNKNSPDTINKVEAYIDEIDEDFKNSNLIKLDNKIVAGFLYSKSKWAFSNNIEFNINIDYYNLRTSLKDYEVIEILSILLDNAIETDVENNTIIINIKNENNQCVLEVLNKHPYMTAEQINVMFKKGYSTKNLQGRGLGLFKLRQSIDKNHGKLHVSNVESENNFILFKVVLPK